MIFAGIIFFILSFTTIFTHQENVWNQISYHLWIIPNWILWSFIIALCLAFIDKIFEGLIVFVILLLFVHFIFVGIYHVNWLFLLRSFIPHMGNLVVKLMVYGFYALVIVLLFVPVLIKKRLQPYKRKNKWYPSALLVIGILILASVILHFSSLIEKFLFPLSHRLWTPNIVVDVVVYGVIGAVILWVMWYLGYGEIFLFDWLWGRKLWREFNEKMRRESESNYENNGSEEGRETLKEPVKEIKIDEEDNAEPLELRRRKLAVEGAYWQNQYAIARTESERRRANDKLREVNEKVKKTKN